MHRIVLLNMPRRWGITFGVITVGVFALIALAISNRIAVGQQAPETPEVGIFEAVLRKTNVPKEFVARVDADSTVEVHARVQGFLDKQLFKDGAMVKEGDMLFLIDPREFEAAVAEARAKLAKARADLASAKANVEVVKAKADLIRDQAALANADKDLARTRPLAEASAVSIQELDQAETKAKEAAAIVDASKAVVRQAQVNQSSSIELALADVQQTSAALATALLNLSYTRVQAPITGLIGKAEENVGSLVGKENSTLLATISLLESVKIYFSVSEQEYLALMRSLQERGGVQKNNQFDLVLADNQAFDQKGKLDFVERAIDPKTGTIQARAIFPNPNQLLRPGQFARLRVTDPDALPSLVIPQRAVMDQQGEQFVLVVDPQGKVERKKITLGARVESFWIVSEGLKAGDKVITDGIQKARPGMTVKVLKSQQ